MGARTMLKPRWQQIVVRLAGDRRGATIIEFAIITPVMIVMMMGIGDMLYQLYAKAVLNGAVQKAARDSAIQGGAQLISTLDNQVIAMSSMVAKTPPQSCTASPAAGTWCSTRKSYGSFAAVAPEPFIDNNGNGVRNAGECYTDVNGNKQWDADPGATGQGGANDVTLYTMSLTYPRLFPVAGLLGWSSSATISAQTLLKNQPYASQQTVTATTICI